MTSEKPDNSKASREELLGKKAELEAKIKELSQNFEKAKKEVIEYNESIKLSEEAKTTDNHQNRKYEEILNGLSNNSIELEKAKSLLKDIDGIENMDVGQIQNKLRGDMEDLDLSITTYEDSIQENQENLTEAKKYLDRIEREYNQLKQEFGNIEKSLNEYELSSSMYTHGQNIQEAPGAGQVKSDSINYGEPSSVKSPTQNAPKVITTEQQEILKLRQQKRRLEAQQEELANTIKNLATEEEKKLFRESDPEFLLNDQDLKDVNEELAKFSSEEKIKSAKDEIDIIRKYHQEQEALQEALKELNDPHNEIDFISSKQNLEGKSETIKNIQKEEERNAKNRLQELNPGKDIEEIIQLSQRVKEAENKYKDVVDISYRTSEEQEQKLIEQLQKEIESYSAVLVPEQGIEQEKQEEHEVLVKPQQEEEKETAKSINAYFGESLLNKLSDINHDSSKQIKEFFQELETASKTPDSGIVKFDQLERSGERNEQVTLKDPEGNEIKYKRLEPTNAKGERDRGFIDDKNIKVPEKGEIILTFDRYDKKGRKVEGAYDVVCYKDGKLVEDQCFSVTSDKEKSYSQLKSVYDRDAGVKDNPLYIEPKAKGLEEGVTAIAKGIENALTDGGAKQPVHAEPGGRLSSPQTLNAKEEGKNQSAEIPH